MLFSLLQTMLRIHDILGWIRIRIRRPMTLTNGSGSFKMPAKNSFFTPFFLLITFWSYTCIIFQRWKLKKSHKIVGIKVFLTIFAFWFLMIEGSWSGSRAGSGSGSIPLASGSGSWRPKNMWIRWIRIRIRNTGSIPLLINSDPGAVKTSGAGGSRYVLRHFMTPYQRFWNHKKIYWIRLQHPDPDSRSGSATLRYNVMSDS